MTKRSLLSERPTYIMNLINERNIKYVSGRTSNMN